jgi:hypothetical protein
MRQKSPSGARAPLRNEVNLPNGTPRLPAAPWSPHGVARFSAGNEAAGSMIVCLRGLCRFAAMSSDERRPARKSEAQYSPHEEEAKHRDLPKLLGQELQVHFKPLRELPHRMLTLLLRLKNIRARHGERRSTRPGGSARSGGRT